MIIQYASDLHLENPENKKILQKRPLIPKGEILILAGDIVPFSQIDQHKDFLDYCSNHFETVYWLPGNHEYYQEDLKHKNDILNESIRSNVYLVNNSIIQKEESRFIFTTLWSFISKVQEAKITRILADFKYIKQNNALLSIEQYNQMHTNCLSFLKTSLDAPLGGKNIIVTHHVPTLLNYPKKLLRTGLQEAFAIELKDYITALNDQNIHCPYWIYGHHHTNVPDFKIANTLLTTNQLVKGFDREKIITL